MNKENKQKKLVRFNLIRMIDEIRELLQVRFAELGLSYSDVVADAHKHGKENINLWNMSRYFKDTSTKGGLKEQDILWLCERWGIKLRISVALKKYDEKKNLNNILHLDFNTNAKRVFVDYQESKI